MSRDQNNPVCVTGISTFQNGIDIRYDGWARDAFRGANGEAVSFYFQAASALLGVAFKFALDPFPGRANSFTCGDGSTVLS